ncbi:MAG: hypothetical protein UIQ90_05110 [Eisenbergiella sp.]
MGGNDIDSLSFCRMRQKYRYSGKHGNIRKVVFYLKHSIYRNGLHDVASGCRITAYIADEKESAQNKSVIVKLSADDVSFELIKQRVQSDGKG